MKAKLSQRTLYVLSAFIVAAVTASVMSLLYAWHIRRQLDNTISRNIEEMLSVVEVDTSLLRQRGYIAAYLISRGETGWLQELDKIEPLFRRALDRVSAASEDGGERAALARVAEAFGRYDEHRDKVVKLFNDGRFEDAAQLYLRDLNELYYQAAALCDQLVSDGALDIRHDLQHSRDQLRLFTWLVASGILLTALLGIALLWLLFSRLFSPLRRMAQEVRSLPAADTAPGDAVSADDIDLLASYLKVLTLEVSHARSSLEEQKQQLSHSEQLAAVGKTVAHIAHEIRNRLTSIGGFARLIESDTDVPQQARNDAAVISQEAAKLERLVGQITTFSKSFSLQPGPASLRDILEGLLPKIAETAPVAIAVEISIDPATPLVLVDIELFELVVYNLVRNAVEAMGTSGSITICASPHDGGAVVSIRDTGPGIPEQIRNKIFEPFFSTKKKGSGLGLAICQKIIDEHGGSISVDSAPGQGTTFLITLPQA